VLNNNTVRSVRVFSADVKQVNRCCVLLRRDIRRAVGQLNSMMLCLVIIVMMMMLVASASTTTPVTPTVDEFSLTDVANTTLTRSATRVYLSRTTLPARTNHKPPLFIECSSCLCVFNQIQQSAPCCIFDPRGPIFEKS